MGIDMVKFPCDF